MPSYVFDNAGPQTRERFASLEALYDARTIRFLAATGVGPGWRGAPDHSRGETTWAIAYLLCFALVIWLLRWARWWLVMIILTIWAVGGLAAGVLSIRLVTL